MGNLFRALAISGIRTPTAAHLLSLQNFGSGLIHEHLQGEFSNLFGNGLSVTSGLNEMYRIGAEKMPHIYFYFRLGFRGHIAEQVAAHLLGFRGPHLAHGP